MIKLGSQGEEQDVVEKYTDLELKLASCLQHHRLSLFKPRILALALISLQFGQESTQMNIDWLDYINYLQQLANVIKRIQSIIYSVLFILG